MMIWKNAPQPIEQLDDFDAYIAQMEQAFNPADHGSGSANSYMPSGSMDHYDPLPIMPPIGVPCCEPATSAALLSPTASVSIDASPRSAYTVRRAGVGNVRAHVSELDAAIAEAKERNRSAQARHRQKQKTEFTLLKTERAEMLRRTLQAEQSLAEASAELNQCRDAMDIQRDMINRLTAEARDLELVDRVDMGVITALEQCAFDMRITRDMAAAQRQERHPCA